MLALRPTRLCPIIDLCFCPRLAIDPYELRLFVSTGFGAGTG
jgi:hypothetical protein